MHPLLALALVLIAGIGVTRLTLPALHHPLLDGVIETGVPFVLLGALLGPGLGILDGRTLRVLDPLTALGIGWVGASFGARLEWRMLRRVSGRTWLVGAALAVPVLLTTGATAWALARSVQPLGDAWGRPFPAVALILAGAATTAASWRGQKLGRRNALLDTAFGTAAAAVGVAWYHPHLALRSIALTVLAAAALGGLFAGFVRWQDDRTDVGVGVALTGVIVAGAGFTYATQLSPFVVCALIAALGVSFSPAAVRVSVQRALRRWEVPLYAAFLIIAGALLQRFTPWLLPAAGLLAVIRAAVRWVTVRFGLDQMDPIWRSLPFPPPREFAFPVMRQGAAAVALAAGFDFVRGGAGGTGGGGGGGGAVFLTVLLSVLAAEAIVVLTPLTAAPRHVEVS
ncbi:MAG: hypothetical protein AUI89_08205 [Gemmatimonadetes bacterium 13_1_40CM_3_65_8]|nr:MAG: hypothetical protein AUI89_08205 [Gemmatimonadetes bacterium 13_1_40CM_3_65_8]